MGLKEILAKLGSERSIRAAFVLEEEIYGEVVKEEGSVTESSMGMPLINRALEEVLKRKVAVCIFCESAFEVPTDHVMVMEDGCGNRVGHDVPSCMADRFKDDPDIFWLCDDFAMYPDKAAMEEIFIVMLPQKVSIVGDDEGARDPVLLYPATTTDILLRKYFGISPDDPKIASAILAFDMF
ncbi:MAG: hypothetical protein FWG60_02360 [Methanomassiliicoccaceae archaeon]|nr:hypothetical protein [Methanomassiliicoccaceae archaeon]